MPTLGENPLKFRDEAYPAETQRDGATVVNIS